MAGPPSSRALRGAVIGYGFIAGKGHVPAYVERGRTSLVFASKRLRRRARGRCGLPAQAECQLCACAHPWCRERRNGQPRREGHHEAAVQEGAGCADGGQRADRPGKLTIEINLNTSNANMLQDQIEWYDKAFRYAIYGDPHPGVPTWGVEI